MKKFLLLCSLAACRPDGQDQSDPPDVSVTTQKSVGVEETKAATVQTTAVLAESDLKSSEKPVTHVDYTVMRVPYRVSLMNQNAHGTAEYSRSGLQNFRVPLQSTDMPPRNFNEFDAATTIVEDDRDVEEPALSHALRGITFDYDHVWLEFDHKNIVLSLQPFSDVTPGYRIYTADLGPNLAYRLYYSPQLQHCRLVYSDTTPTLTDLKRPAQTYIRDYTRLPCAFHNEPEPWSGSRIFERGSAKPAQISMGKSLAERADPKQTTELSARILERSVRVIKLQLDRKHTPNEEQSWSHSLDHIFSGEIFQKVGEPFVLELDVSHPEFAPTMMVYKLPPAAKSKVEMIAKWSLLTQKATLEIKNHPDFSDAMIVLQGDD